jgi:D-tyrosyl-tRNA(Tyr) deacylase
VKLVVQRVLRASVRVDGETVGAIDRGLLILCGVARGDTRADADYLARKTIQLRVFDDADGKMNLAAGDLSASFLVVSQFTLYGDCAKGNRPSYIEAAPPEEGELGYERFVASLRALGARVQTGRFRAMMEVELVNEGPVTLLLESHGRTAP